MPYLKKPERIKQTSIKREERMKYILLPDGEN